MNVDVWHCSTRFCAITSLSPKWVFYFVLLESTKWEMFWTGPHRLLLFFSYRRDVGESFLYLCAKPQQKFHAIYSPLSLPFPDFVTGFPPSPPKTFVYLRNKPSSFRQQISLLFTCPPAPPNEIALSRLSPFRSAQLSDRTRFINKSCPKNCLTYIFVCCSLSDSLPMCRVVDNLGHTHALNVGSLSALPSTFTLSLSLKVYRKLCLENFYLFWNLYFLCDLIRWITDGFFFSFWRPSGSKRAGEGNSRY